MTSRESGLVALEKIATVLKKEYDSPEDAEWKNHPLAWIRSKPSARIGKIGRLLIQALCEQEGISVSPVGYSLVIAGKTFQVRFSTGWSGGGFKFEQLRYENYEAIICLAVTPQRAFAWVIPKVVIFDARGAILKKVGLTSQHGGKGGSDTAWINVDVQSIPAWMNRYGGSIADSLTYLRDLIQGSSA